MESTDYIIEAHNLLAFASHNRETGPVCLRDVIAELRAHIAGVVAQQQQERQEQQDKKEDEQRK